MRLACVPLVVLGLLAVASSVLAQPVEIVATDPAAFEVDVPLSKRVTFELSKPTPTFGTAFASKFMWSPTDSTQLSVFGHDYGEGGKLTEVFFELDHAPATDFTFIAYGVEAEDGSRMARPHVLRYSTASEFGSHAVRGTISFGERTLEPTSAAAQLASAVRRSIYAAGALAEDREPSEDVPGALARARGAAGSEAHYEAAFALPSDEDAGERTVVLLLDRYEKMERRWHIRAAAVPNAEGDVEVSHIRDGTYWPAAFAFAGEEGESIGAFGFFDADGDLQPDSIRVTGGDVSGVDLTLYPYGAFAAGANVGLARDVAAQVALDQQLVNIRVLRGPSPGVAYEDGTADLWRYTFFSLTENRVTYVLIDPINVYVSATPATSYDARSIDELVIDSDEAVQIADEHGGSDFRARYPADQVLLTVEAGDLALTVRPREEAPFWRVHYRSPPGLPVDELVVFVDVQTGALLEGVTVSVSDESAHPRGFFLQRNYPNPFSASTELRYGLAQQGRARLTIFNMLGQQVATLVDEVQAPGAYTVRWDAAGVVSGAYVCRLESGGHVQTRTIILAR